MQNIDIVYLLLIAAIIIFIPRGFFSRKKQSPKKVFQEARSPYTYYGLVFFLINMIFSLLYFSIYNTNYIQRSQTYVAAILLVILGICTAVFAKKNMDNR